MIADQKMLDIYYSFFVNVIKIRVFFFSESCLFEEEKSYVIICVY